MPRITEVDGIVFSEDPIDGKPLGKIEIKARTQNTPLSEMKQQAAAEAKRLGANAVGNYRYGQRADSTIRDVFGFRWDSERISVSGDAVTLETEAWESLRGSI